MLLRNQRCITSESPIGPFFCGMCETFEVFRWSMKGTKTFDRHVSRRLWLQRTSRARFCRNPDRARRHFGGTRRVSVLMA